MTIRETLQALLDGKKVRERNWENGEFIYFDQASNFILDELDRKITFAVSNHTDYELYQPAPKMVKAWPYKRDMSDGTIYVSNTYYTEKKFKERCDCYAELAKELPFIMVEESGDE